MIGAHPIKQILVDTQAHWDHDRTPAHVREHFLKAIQCKTLALGAEVYASETETKLLLHTCKSPFCTSCGQVATEAWQEDLEAILPEAPYVGITLTMPKEFRPILQQNRRLLHAVPAMGAEAILHWAKADSGVRLIVVVVQQTFGGFLNFVPHLHIMVSAGGLQESTNRWIARLRFNEEELMQAWRFALIALLAEAYKKNTLKSDLSSTELRAMLAAQYKRQWQIYINRARSKSYLLKHDGRYIRRPPVWTVEGAPQWPLCTCLSMPSQNHSQLRHWALGPLRVNCMVIALAIGFLCPSLNTDNLRRYALCGDEQYTFEPHGRLRWQRV